MTRIHVTDSEIYEAFVGALEKIRFVTTSEVWEPERKYSVLRRERDGKTVKISWERQS